LNGFTQLSHAVNDGTGLSGLCGESLCHLRKREKLREGPLLTALLQKGLVNCVAAIAY
jgi:hypothetical protein